MPEAEGNGFVVSDKRQFTPEGEEAKEKKTPAPEEKPEPKDEAPKEKTEAAGEAKAQARPEEPQAGHLPEIDFSTFVFSLSSSVLFHLGLAADPQTGQNQVNLPLAKQTIDIIAMLQKKTAGNLDEEESRLLEGVLYDLRLRYVEATKSGQTA